MRIGTRNDDSRPKRLKPPPNYGSRRVQFRLFVIVASLMLVLTLIVEARNPNRWRWLWQFDRNAQSSTSGDLDTRIPPPVSQERDAGEIVVGQARATAHKSSVASAAGGRDLLPEERAWTSAWRDTYDELSFAERTELYDILRAASEQSTAATESDESSERSKLNESLQRLEVLWTDYLRTARQSLTGLTEDERNAWRDVLNRLEKRWNETAPLLRQVASGEKLAAAKRDTLADVLDLLDQWQLKTVQDNTVFRASEREIWFRLLGELQQSSPEALAKQSTGEVGYAQLFKQSDFYRGKLVTVRGTADAVYPINAPPNSYGIKRYWVYWLRPAGGPNSPLIVYALNKPKGFPAIEYADLNKVKMASLEDVTFTGYFFKRYAYQGKGDIYTAPLVLALEPEWIPSAFTTREELPSLPVFLAIAAALALLAAALAWWVYYQYPSGRPVESMRPVSFSNKDSR